jgi:hypothetical protein
MNTAHHSERGQALVLIILAIVGLFGFSALAVDFGRIYAERRRAQSAVDAAVMAGAFASSQGDDWLIAARAVMAENDYFENPPIVIHYSHPAETGPYSDTNREDYDQYFQVRLETKVDPIFAHFVYGGPMDIEVEAVARAAPTTSISPGNAITATRRDICPGIVFNGGMKNKVIGGNIFSNAAGTNNGNCYSSISTGSSGTITVQEGDFVVANEYNGPATVNANIIRNAGHQTFPAVPEPYCDDLPIGTADASTGILHAGRHTSMPNSFGNGDWVMEEGMHCFYTDFTKNGGSLTSDGYGVFIVMKSGGVSIGGNADISLRAIYGGPDGYGYKDGGGNQWSGMLLYMSNNNTNGVDLSGNSGSNYTGTIYAAGNRVPETKEKCNIGGTNDTMAMNSALICSSVGIAGDSDVTIIYREPQNYRLPPRIELTQ